MECWSTGSHKKIVQSVQSLRLVQPLRSVKAPTSFLPRDAGEDEGGGLNGLNGLNYLNQKGHHHSSTPTPPR
jgi:hypothetical protein